MADAIVLLIVAAIVVLISLYLYRAKKRGQKCIGCPDSGSCSGSCPGCCGSCNGCESRK